MKREAQSCTLLFATSTDRKDANLELRKRLILSLSSQMRPFEPLVMEADEVVENQEQN